MNLFQACQPGGWPSSSKMNRGGNKERVQPLILDVHSNPPILDTSLLDLTHPKTHTTQRKPPSEMGGLLWRQLNTMYQTFHKMWAAPVTWVNPEVMVDPQLYHLQHLNSQPHYPPITKALNPEAPLWFPAEPGGSYLDFIDPLMYPYMDPLNLMQEKGSYPYHMDPSSLKQCKGPYPYQPSHHTQPGKFTSVKVNKPLNPEAKEWVPNNYSCSSQAPVSSVANLHMNEKRMETSNMNGISTSNPGEIPIIPNGLNCSVVPEVLNDFCEITENEINAVRQNFNTYPIVARKDKDEYKVDEESEMEPTNLEESSPKDNQNSEKRNISDSWPSQCDRFTSLSPPGSTSQRVREETVDDSVGIAVAAENISSDGDRTVAVVKNESLNGGTIAAIEKSKSLDDTPALVKNESLRGRTTAVKKNESLNGDISLPVSKVTTIFTSDNSVNDSCSLSYAKIVGRAPPSPPPSPECPDKSQDSSAKYEKVVQPLPKIFMKDKVYPKEKAPPAVDNRCKASGLFKSVSKTQKATSKNFLKELKSSVKANENGINVDLICIELPESPPRISSPKEGTTLPLHCSFSIGQKAHNSECSSSDSRIRSVSESSTTSVESLDVDFVDEVDNFKECKKLTSDTADDLDKAVAKGNFKACRKSSPSSPKFSNVLACILGYDETESEESEDEDDEDEDFDDDWDKVCGENGPIDDTWETFGFGLIISGAAGKFPCTQVAVNQCNDKNTCKNQRCDKIPESVVCDSASDEEDVPVSDVSLEEINRKWEEEIEKDVLVQSERRVQFGGVSIHPLVTWSFARREARKGPWEQYARDRARFCQRIASLEPTLSLVLNPEHRDCVYKKMQQNSWPS